MAGEWAILMSKLLVNKEIYKLTPSTLVDLFELDTTNIDDNRLPESMQVMMFHNFVSEGYYPIYFNGRKYSPAPIEFKGAEMKSDGTTLPRPRATIGNADGAVSYYISKADGLVGAKLTRKRTFARFLDGDTWGLASNQNPFGTPDGESFISEDVYYVDKVLNENKQFVEFELASILELYKLKLPRRRMFAINCGFDYRNSSGCYYTGTPKSDVSNKKFETSVANGGYGFTLNERGEWDKNETYNQGDYVYIQSSFTIENSDERKKYYYVCLENNITGENNRPTKSQKWKMDACSHKINGCLCRFNSFNLPFGGFPGLIRVDYENF